jgi:penicillin-binding protein 2
MQTFTASKYQTWLPWFLRGILILGFIILSARLFELQIIKGDYFRNLAEGNRIRKVMITAPRGRILARGGEVLVANKEVKRRIIFDPTEGYEKSDEITAGADDEIITEWLRDYVLADKFAHVSGYLGKASENEVGKVNPNCSPKGPRSTETFVGRSGLEQKYECILSGIDGEELIEVNTTGRKIRLLGKKNPVPGDDIKTTIDYGLQKKVAEVMQGKPGAVVISDIRGEILALYSSPSYNPNLFLDQKNSKKIEELLNDQQYPLFNRAIGGLYHPGSVFKTIVAIAGLEEGIIDENYIYEDPGVITINEFSYSNWYFTQYGGKEGQIGLVRALKRSTDTFFYKLGELLGVNKLVDWSKKFGLDSKTGIDLIGEVSGLVPSPEWKKDVKNENWFLGNTYHMAIGQGDLALTPLQVNSAVEAIANQGKLCYPRIADKTDCIDLELSESNIDLVIKGMVEACSDGGTGYTFFGSNPQVACKTGTAETGEKDISHAWFTFFAPVNLEDESQEIQKIKPEIVVTVLIEKGGEGSKVAGPIAREIFDYWFKQDIKDQDITSFRK